MTRPRAVVRRLPTARDERPLEPGEPVGEPAGAGVEMDGVDREVVASGRGDRLVEPVQADPELGRSVAGVLEMLVVAGADPRIDADPDRRRRGARRPYRSTWLIASRLRWMPWASRTSRSRSETFVPV